MNNPTLESIPDSNPFFSTPQDTKEAAISLYEYQLFNPAAVFKTPQGKFVLGKLKPHLWTEDYVKQVAIQMQHLLQYEMVAHCPPLIHNWKDFDIMAVIDSELKEMGYNPQELGKRFNQVAQDALRAVQDDQ